MLHAVIEHTWPHLHLLHGYGEQASMLIAQRAAVASQNMALCTKNKIKMGRVRKI